MEIIRIVENSELSVRKTLKELNVNRGSFYNWYKRYKDGGYEGLTNKDKGPKRFWNRIPEIEKQRVVEIALEQPEKSPRELAWHITDTEGYYISESSVYRILKGYDLITSPAFIVMSARDKFKDPTRRINEMWQTDFTYFKITGWGWYYLATVLDDYSRYVITWKLTPSMLSTDVMEVLEDAKIITGIDKVNIRHRPRLLTDNGPCYLSGELRQYLNDNGIAHTRGAPYHPQTQGKIERFHRSMKNIVKLDNYYYPWALKEEISRFIDYYNNERYHESLNNVTPSDVWFGRYHEIETRREKIKKITLQNRKKINLKSVV
jgi:transposase InsO family protein